MPEAWGYLAVIYGQVSDALRRARTADQISEGEWQTLSKLYPKELAAYQITLRLDPLFGGAWREAAAAATFAGDAAFADKAIWKAAQLDRGDPRVYSWGLEMYDPKWFGGTEKRLKVADTAAADSYPTPEKTADMASILYDAGYRPQARTLYDRAVPMYRARIAAQPTDRTSIRGLAVALYQEIVRQLPSDPNVRMELAISYYSRSMQDDALREFNETLRLKPQLGMPHSYIGFIYLNQNKLDEAKSEFLDSLSIDSNDPFPHYGLGNIYDAQQKLDAAITEYRQAIRLNRTYLSAYVGLAKALCAAKQFDSALEAARIAVELGPEDDTTHTSLAYVYLMLKDAEHSAEESRTAIRLNPKNATAHDYLGEALLALGKKEEARAEWSLVLTLDHGAIAEDAKRSLAKNP
jgi:tetratricopeptide (TPR) repeat protein